MSKGTIFMMAGGTGGHVVPALSVARGLADKGYEVRWLGTRAGIEARLVPEAGFAIDWLEIGGVRGKGVMTRLLAPWRLLRAVLAARRIMVRHKPVLAVGMGGYASGPGGLAAWWLGVPLVIHEQNAIAGMTNRILSRFARQTLAAYLQAFEGTRARNVTVVGNPVRPEITALPDPARRMRDRTGPVRVLVLGGSLGAKALNETIPSALVRVSLNVPLEVRHQAGSKHLADTRQNYHQSIENVRGASDPGRFEIVDFISDMAESYEWADFVIARAGALTVAEIAAAGVGALFIPFPYAVDDHQTRNASALKQAGAAMLIQQRDLDVGRLTAQLSELFADRGELKRMAQSARGAAFKDSLAMIVALCERNIKTKTTVSKTGEAES